MPSEIRFAELRKRLEQSGWYLDRVRGSHHIFEKAGRPRVVIPVHKGKCKPVYGRIVEKAIKDDLEGR